MLTRVWHSFYTGGLWGHSLSGDKVISKHEGYKLSYGTFESRLGDRVLGLGLIERVSCFLQIFFHKFRKYSNVNTVFYVCLQRESFFWNQRVHASAFQKFVLLFCNLFYPLTKCEVSKPWLFVKWYGIKTISKRSGIVLPSVQHRKKGINWVKNIDSDQTWFHRTGWENGLK